MSQNKLLIVDSLRDQLLETYRNLTILCEIQGCESYRQHILEQYRITDIEALSDDELSLLNNMTSGCILAWVT